ncbi:MAG: hypothetical protein AAF223_05615, partial [Bacteroidota bacterium]
RNTATRTSPASPVQRQTWELAQLQDQSVLANLLTTAQQGAQTYQKMQVSDTVPIWVTEFNMRDDHSVVLHSWSQALVLAAYYLEFLNSPAVLTNVHNLVGHLFGQVHTDTATFAHLLTQNVISHPYTLTAGGIATSLFARATNHATEGVLLVMKEIPPLVDDRGISVASVQGWLFTSDKGGKTGLLVNFGYEQQLVEWPQTLPGGQARSYWAKLAEPINGWESLESSQQKVQDESLYLPPHSMTIIEVDE